MLPLRLPPLPFRTPAPVPLSALAVILALLPAAPPARAGAYGEPLPEPLATVEVLPGWAEAGRQVAALRIALAPGWKTYWRSPGEAGIAPLLDAAGSRNLARVAFAWPVPEVFEVGGMRSIGYPGELVLPMLLTPADPSRPIRLRAELDMGVCRDICVPFSARLAADLPPLAGQAGTQAHDRRIAGALARRPASAAEAGVRAVSCTVEPIPDGLRVTARIELPAQGRDEVLVIEPGEAGVWVSDAHGRRGHGALTATADLVPPAARPFALDRSQLRLTVLGDGRAVEIQGCPAG